jgi:hypothetical protein
MIEISDTSPDVNVHPDEYARLLGFPAGKVVEGRSLELMEWARRWYADNGRPWVYAREAQSLRVTNGSIVIDGVAFASPRLQNMLANAEAHSAILVAVCAGTELESSAHRLWLDEKPDEYFFLEVFGSAVVERLIAVAGARLCAWAENESLAVLPHYSPGYPEWNISDQPVLLNLIGRHRLPGGIETLDTGMLRPKKSLLAVFGLTRKIERVDRLTDLVPCAGCSFSPCQYRRVPYRSAMWNREPGRSKRDASPLAAQASYRTNRKALARWTSERLSLTAQEDGSIHALFRYDGTTCSNMGQPLAFHYRVTLGPRSEGFPIREQDCRPAPGDNGHRAMCGYLSNATDLMSSIENEKPLLGKRLDEVVGWDRPDAPAGCYCDPAMRQHKWGLVLETIHFALWQLETQDHLRAGHQELTA